MSWTESKKLLAIVGLCAVTLLASFLLRSFTLLLISSGIVFVVLAIYVNFLRSISIVFASFVFAASFADYLVGTYVSYRINVYHDAKADYASTYGRTTELGSQANQGVHSSRLFSRSGEIIYDATYSIGADGFRLTDQTQFNKKRINFFGCSFTFGEGLNDNETLPYYFSRQRSDFSVKNFGFHGYGPHQALNILLSDRDTSGILNFFLTAPWHAPRSACRPSYTALSPRYVLIGGSLEYVGKCGESNLGNVGGYAKRIISQSGIYKFILQAQLLEAPRNEDFDLYLAIIEKMYKISKDRGQLFVVGFIKAEDKFFKGTAYTNQILIDELKLRSDQLVDLTLSESAESLQPEYFIHPLDKHPSAYANAQRAKILASLFYTIGENSTSRNYIPRDQ